MRNLAAAVCLCIVVVGNLRCVSDPMVARMEPVRLDETSVGREGLIIPYQLWREVRAGAGYGVGEIGLSFDEMQRYHGSPHRLAAIDRLFRDPRRAPAMTSTVAVRLIKEQTTADAARTAFRLLGHSTRGQSPQKKEQETPVHSWKVTWIDDALNDDQTFDRLVEHCRELGVSDPVDDSSRRRWQQYPPAVKRLFLRMAIAVVEAAPRMATAYDRSFLERSSFTKDGGLTHNNLRALALYLWEGDGEPRRDAWENYDRLDLAALSFAITRYLDRVDEAVAEWTASGLGCAELKQFAGNDVIVATPMGTIRMGYNEGPSAPAHHAVTIELGGDTSHENIPLQEHPLDVPVTTILDLGGNDTYSGAVAFGCYNASMVFDLSGDDRYEIRGFGLGCGLFGAGILRDYRGNDSYTQTGLYSEGMALAGIGLLIDDDGDDRYSCGADSQGVGLTLGVGMLIDRRGNDVYRAAVDDPAAFSSAWGRSVSIAQGAGFGLRADYADGHSLGGGIGGLIDGAGNDSYESGIFSQGSGYWYGFGFLEDLDGDDTYRALAYSQGCGVHMAVGSLCDASGNDHYNAIDGVKDVPFAKQLGASRDGSVGVFFDGAGDDTYVIASLMCGTADIVGVALFWDRMGNDSYTIDLKRDDKSTACLGAAVPIEENGGSDPRERFLTTGIFLDTGGDDTYDGKQYLDPYKKGGALQAGNDRVWFHDRRPGFTGFGIDRELFTASPRESGKGSGR